MILPGSLAAILDEAARILSARGMAKGVSILPNGSVDLFGALLLAANARNVTPGDADPERAGVPDALIPLVLEAYETLYGLRDDLDLWMDEPTVTVTEGVALLLQARDVVGISLWRREAGSHDESSLPTEEAGRAFSPD